MKARFITTIGLFLFMCCLSLSAFSQDNAALISDLNKVLKKSLYETTIKIDDKGFVKREDNNGNTFEFNLNDIKRIGFDDDGFNNIIIEFKEGKKAKGIIAKKDTEMTMNVISFKDKSDCDKSIEIFNNLIKK
jgi:hypothetical protein